MEVRRTVPVKLEVTDSDAALLHETIDQFRDAANFVVRHAHEAPGFPPWGWFYTPARQFSVARWPFG